MKLSSFTLKLSIESDEFLNSMGTGLNSLGPLYWIDSFLREEDQSSVIKFLSGTLKVVPILESEEWSKITPGFGISPN